MNFIPFNNLASAKWKFGEDWSSRFDGFSADNYIPVTIVDMVSGEVAPFTAPIGRRISLRPILIMLKIS